MAFATTRSPADRVIIENVSWDTYEAFLKDLENRSSPRLAFDQGVLEIVTPHLEHESVNRALATIVEIALEEFDLDFANAGSTTFKREALKRGCEPDSCFYIQNADRIRRRRRIDLDTDPPPDLLIEVDLTKSPLDKLPLYAALGVPEVWRYEDALEIWILNQGRYSRSPTSGALPALTEKLVSQFVDSRLTMRGPAWLRQTRERIRGLKKAK